MRYISALLIVTLFLLFGCSSTPDQMEPKTTSAPITIDVHGNIYWDVLPNPPLDLEIRIYKVFGVQDATIYAPQDAGGYSESASLSVSGADYEFVAFPPDGYEIYGNDTIIVKNVIGDVYGIDFAVRAE